MITALHLFLIVITAGLFTAFEVAPDRVTKAIFAFLFMCAFLYTLTVR